MSDRRVRMETCLVASNTQTISSHTADVTSVAFSHSLLVTCSADKTIRLFDTNKFDELSISPLLGHTFPIHCCSLSPLGSMLATCSTDGTVRLWILKTGEQTAVLSHESKCAIRVCQFSSDGSLLITGGDDDHACLWNVANKKLLKTLKGHEESITAAAFSPDGNYVVTGSSGGDFGGELLVWDAQFGHGKFLHRVTDCHDLGVSCCQFSQTFGSAGEKYTGSHREFLLVTGGKDNLVKLWRMNCEVGSTNVSVKLDTMLPGHNDSVLWLSISPDGAMIASSSLDKTVRLWNTNTKQALLSLDSHTSYVSCCAFSTNSKTLATASNDQTVKVWQLSDTSNIMKGLQGYEDSPDVESQALEAFSHVCVQAWSVEDVCQWLSALGLEDYEDTFRSNAIDGRELLSLTANDLQTSLGITALGHRNKLLRAREMVQDKPIGGSRGEPSRTPDEFLCPISQEIMTDPVIASDGYTYDRAAILSWMTRQQRSPMTNVQLNSTDVVPNRTLKMMIQKFLQTSNTKA